MKVTIVIGALMALSGVMLGALGAHGLKSVLAASDLLTFEIGVKYQMYHGLAILLLPGLRHIANAPWLVKSAWLFIAGCVLFSGSLYLLALTGQKWFGPITPIGGLCFMLGWLCVIIGLITHNNTEASQ